MNEYVLTVECKLRSVKHLNDVIEQAHRAIRMRRRAAQCFRSIHTAERALEGIATLHVMWKGEVKRIDGRDSSGRAKLVVSLFGVAARRKLSLSPFATRLSFRTTARV